MDSLKSSSASFARLVIRKKLMHHDQNIELPTGNRKKFPRPQPELVQQMCIDTRAVVLFYKENLSKPNKLNHQQRASQIVGKVQEMGN